MRWSPLDTVFHSGMMGIYTLTYYTNVMNRHQRLESHWATHTVVMHRRSLSDLLCL